MRELKVNDCYGGVGAIDLTFPEHEVTMTPEGGRVGSEMVVSGRNFPVFNNGGSEVEIAVMYEAAGRERDRETVEPDEAGNFTVALNVPEDAAIPSNNTGRVEFADDNGFLTSDTIVHRVLPRTVAFNPTSGPEGTVVTLTGQGFKPYTTVNRIDFGALDFTAGAGLFTDEAGGFETTFMVPATHAGYHAVLVKVGETTASAPFTVTADSMAPTSAPARMSPPSVLAPLIANDNNLVRVWQFDASRQAEAPDFGWFLYDTREVFASANNLEIIEGGSFYWNNIREDHKAIMGGKERVLHSGWNPVTW